MSYIIDDIKVKASKMQRVIVLPESDDIRILNGNLEIQLLPFTEKDTTL